MTKLNNCITAVVSHDDLLRIAENDPNLIVYMLKIHMYELNIPVVIDPLSIRSNTLEVMHGQLEVTISLTSTEIKWTANE